MRILLFLVIFVAFSLNFAFAQNCSCITDLNEIATVIKKAPSYKDAIREKGLSYFENELLKIKMAIATDPHQIKNCSAYIQKYLSFFNDKHLALNFDYSKIKTQKDVFQSELYKLTQTRKIDSNNLHFTTAIEGIYTDVFRTYKIALIKDSDNVGQYLGVVLSTKTWSWQPNQVKFILKQIINQTFDGFFYDDLHFARYNKVTYANDKLNGVEWVKEERMKLEPINPFIVPTKKKWDYKKLNQETDYVYLGTFSGMLFHQTDSFYRALIPKLKAEKLIIDVRNNGGGGERGYKMFLNFVNSKNCFAKQIIIIQNSGSASATEHFILAMRKNPLVKTYGENTAGLTGYGYGNRSGIMLKTSCFGYISHITEAKYSKFKMYETIGISPDVKLSRDKDWIEQIF